MPILDPLQQYYFYRINHIESCPYEGFLHHFLRIASDRFLQNLVSIRDYINFENLILCNIEKFNKLFGSKIPDKNQLEQEQIDDYFDYLDRKLYNNHETINGTYFTLHSKENVCEQFFGIRPERSDHYWFFTDSSIAVLCLVGNIENNAPNENNDYIELEILLMKSLGLTLVLIYRFYYKIDGLLSDLIQKKYFSEIHIEFECDCIHCLDQFLLPLYNNRLIYPFYGYFYLYSYNNTDTKFKKKYKSNPYCKEIIFAFRIKDCLTRDIKYSCKPFNFCSTGSKTSYIKIILCNVPLFDQKNLEDCLSPSKLSGITCCYVKQEDFLVYKGTRVEVLFKDNTTKYADFADIHLMKPELFVTNMLYLMKSQFKSNEELNLIKQKAEKKIADNKHIFKYEKIHKILRNKKTVVKDTIAYLSYAVAMLKSKNSNEEFRLRDNQIFTIYQSCFSCLFDTCQIKKGIVYQIDTGEGKSIIIQLIAALLAINNDDNYVHIASSNIYLSKRDYSQSYDLYQKLQISSSVLLHESELSTDEYYRDKEIDKSHFRNNYFDKQSFENSLNMNYCAFGINNDYNTIQCPKILFSTFINFEAMYLKLIDNWEISRVEKYFKNRFLIIDEADSILIDDLTNGTIISRPIKSNAKELLTLVYQCKLGKLSKSNIQIIASCFDSNLEKSTFIDKFSESYANINLNQEKELLKFDNITSIQIENAKKIMLLLHKSNNDQLSDDLIRKIIIAIWPNRNQETFFKQMIEYYKKCPKESVSNIIINNNYFNFIVFICQTKTGCINSNNFINIIKKIWPDTVDITPDHLNSMYKEIEIVHSPEFVDGKKYSIKPIRKKSEHKKSKIISGLSKLIKIYNEFNHYTSRESNDSKEEEETLEIVPFDYNNKGILEWNKEFSGFIQQFIAIKEMINNEKYKGKIRVKDIALNYSFVSHPILVKLYKKVCGFTGTIGNFNDREILRDQYQIETFKIPRSSAKNLIILPTILCKNYGERNNKIIEEVLSFHLLKKPVLVILQDLIEIDTITRLFADEGITKINVFTNNEEKNNPEEIVGMSGEISLGTNFCGRGTDIKFQKEPLHIIVSYYTNNKRVLNQAFGRTARLGNIGTCRIICAIDEYLQPVRNLDNQSINFTNTNIILKRKYQSEFINYYQANSKIIFDLNINKQKITNDKVFQLKSDLNVNRMIAYNYKYPAVMTVDTFLSIQAQKIFSIYNCPNCKYTWKLFQRYIKEMILESWAIGIRELDRNEYDSITYENKLYQIVSYLKRNINVYIPTTNNIFSIFENIYNRVKNQWEDQFFSLYSTINENYLYKKKTNVGHFMCINFGFIPYTLVDESGSRINSFDNSTNMFILDPEISYYRNKIRGIRASITEKIDKLFNEICKKINEKIGCFTGLRFFLRRTLFGCEFGMCMDFSLENKYCFGPNCLFDKDPLLIFTLHIKSSEKTPILAGILIVVLVYVSKICSFIFGGLPGFIKQVSGKKIAEAALIEILKFLSENRCFETIDKIFNFLNDKFQNILNSQIEKIRKYDRTSKVADILFFVSRLINQDNFNLLNSALGHFKIKQPVLDHFKGIFAHLFKVGINIFLCLVAFFMNFRFRSSIKYYNEKKEAKIFDKNQNVNESYNKNYAKITKVNDI